MGKRIYVGNIPFTATEEEIKELFQQHGEVISVDIIKDRETNRSKGFCFIDMENADEAMAKLSGTEFNGRKLFINDAKEKVRGTNDKDSQSSFRAGFRDRRTGDRKRERATFEVNGNR